MTPVERFWLHVEKTETCWLWTLKPMGRGYGHFSIDGKQVRAHRYSYELHYGPIPDGLLVCHTCDVLLCVRPDHLFLGTHDDNMADMAAKGRSALGTRNGRARLSEDDVLAIYRDQRPTPEIAADYGIGRPQISRIRTGKRWSWLTGASVLH